MDRIRLAPGGNALVTGGGSGIGRGIALALARRGVAVAVTGRRRDALEVVVAQIQEAGGMGVALPADITRSEERAELVERVHKDLGPLAVLVNNAGVLAGGNLIQHSEYEIEQATTVNLLAPIDLTRRFHADLVAQRGAVVLVASYASVVPYPSASLYSATKAGLAAFGEAVRYELDAAGVRLLVAYPPGTSTDMIRGMQRRAGVPESALRSPEIVGEAIVKALERGRRELRWHGSERVLAWAYQIAPWLVRTVFRTQQASMARIMSDEEQTYR